MALPTPMNTPNVPPVCSITLPSWLNSSLPRRPYLMPATVPNIAPVLKPTAKPIITPYLMRSKHVGPPVCLGGAGILLV